MGLHANVVVSLCIIAIALIALLIVAVKLPNRKKQK